MGPGGFIRQKLQKLVAGTFFFRRFLGVLKVCWSDSLQYFEATNYPRAKVMAALRTQPGSKWCARVEISEKGIRSSSYVYDKHTTAHPKSLKLWPCHILSQSFGRASLRLLLVQYPTLFFHSFPVSLNKVCPLPDGHFPPLLLVSCPVFPSMAAFRAAGLQAVSETEAACSAMLHRI